MFTLPLDVATPCTSISLAEADKLFFSDTSKSRIAKAKALCADCPITSKCLQFAIDEGIEYGIFGGCTPDERNSL